MLAIAILSLLLLGLSGVMIDSQLKTTRRRLAVEGLAERDRKFFRRQHRWRMAANVLIGAVGALVAVWPVVPRTREWMAIYLGLILLATIGMVMMAGLDAFAISRRYRRDRMEIIAQQARHALDLQRKKLQTQRKAAGEEE